MPKVSVLMPVYNSEKYLNEAIDSIIGQSFIDWELIVINDGSTDASKQIIESHADSRIQYYENDKNMGLIETLNKGVGLCRGEYIARMDADDISLTDRFFLQVDFLEKNEDYAMCGTNALVIDEKGEETGKILNLSTNEYLQVNLLFSVPFVHPSLMIRASVLKHLSFDGNYIHAEDYDLWCRIAENYKVANLSSFLVRYRWHTTNVSVIYKDIQQDMKNQIMRRQIEGVGLHPNDNDLYLHRITFEQYNAKDANQRKGFGDYVGLNNWFHQIIKANNASERYDPDALSAYLWSRWIVLCIAQRNYMKAFNPKFISFKPNVLRRTLALILFLQKK